jgi:hypothetical protein
MLSVFWICIARHFTFRNTFTYSVGVSFTGLSVGVGVVVEESGTAIEGVESDAGAGVGIGE